MSTTSLLHRWRRAVPLWVGAGVMMGLVALYAPEAPAQAKKDDPAKAKKEVEAPAPSTAAKFIDIIDSKFGGTEQLTLINEHIEKGWKDNKIAPADRCSDYEFIRRASLDIIGRIATVAEINRFYKDPPERRRSLLINRLIDNPEFGENFANIWTVMLMTRSGSVKDHQDQLREWLTDQFNKADPKAGWATTVSELISAQGVTNENPAVNFILHHIGEEQPAGDRSKTGRFDMVPVTSRTTKLFLGLRTQCVQCHDHPFNGEWQQSHFWGINAFYRQVDAPRGRPAVMMAKKKGVKEGQRELVDNPTFNANGMIHYERRNAAVYYTKSTFLDGKKIPVELNGGRRKELAKFITNSPYFSKVMVNRMWGHFMGKSFTKDNPDDFGEHNPVSHPELLDKLAEDWAKKYNHNPKDLVRWICNSRAYGLASVANKTNDKPEDEVLFARMLLKPMTPEQLFDSLVTATQAQTKRELSEKKKQEVGEQRERWMANLAVNFGNDEGEEGTYNGTVVQALLLMNGADINSAINDRENGTVAAVLKARPLSAKGAQESLKELFLAALNRPPTKKESSDLLNPKMYQLPLSKASSPDAFWTAYYQDVFWALLNSNEFILNH